jgi:nucleotide-binding universal stress UspA family protein
VSNRKIVVGVDFSPESELAAQHALAVASRIGSELMLVHAGAMVEIPVVPRTSPPATAQIVEIYRTQIDQALRRDRDRLSELRHRLAGQGAEVSQILIEGYADQGVVDAARELGAELVVIGTHGRTGLRWFSLGSVAEHVLRASESDVLVARGDVVPRGGFHRILVATDFSPGSGRALDRALWLAAPAAHVDVVHFFHGASRVEPHDAIRTALAAADLNRAIAAELGARGERFVAEHARAGLALKFHVAADGPIPGIVHLLERQPYDLTALGRHGRRGSRRLAPGSVAEAVARRAPCCVLVAGGAH